MALPKTAAAELILRWRHSPPLFVRECLGVTPDAWQDEFLEQFGKDDVRRIAMKANKGPGKTASLAWCILNFMLCRSDGYAGHPKGVATSITGDNLRDNLWAELAKWQKVSPLLERAFQWSAERFVARESPEDWFISARSWPKAGDQQQQANTLAGVHAKAVLFVLDESAGIPEAVMAAAEGALATVGTWAKIVQAGNPTHTSGPLYRACTDDRHLWYVIEVTGDPDDPKRSTRIRKDWAREQIAKYGRNNPWVLVNVFGKFPPSSINTLLGPDEVQAAMRRNPPAETWHWSQKRLGIDVARFGDDSCFDDETEILTDEGWKLFSGLHGREGVLTIGANDIRAEWGEILHIHKSDFDGELNLHEKKHMNFCVTDNHRMFVRTNPKSEAYGFKPFLDLPKEFVVREDNGWSGTNPPRKSFESVKAMPNGGTCICGKHSFSFLDWAALLGWFVSEGNVYVEKRRNGRKRSIITQYPGWKRDSIEALLNRMGIRWRACSNGFQIEFSSKPIAEYLLAECGIGAHNKRVPCEIKNAGEAAIGAFLDAFLLGDGTCAKNGNGRTYVTSSKGLADDIQEMLAKLGRAGSIRLKYRRGTEFRIKERRVVRKHDVYVVYERRAFTGKYCRKRDVAKVPYTGKVWCVATPKESIYVRRRGIPMWSGNSVLFPRQGLMAFRPVEMRVADTVQIAGRAALAIHRWHPEIIAIDDTGHWGHGVIDNLRATGHNPIGIQYHAKAMNPRYKNRRVEMWMEMSEWVKRGGALPMMTELARELTAPTYTYANGQFVLEDKDQIKSRLGRSPDFADALCFEAGTMIRTPAFGPVPIEDIAIGDTVSTPLGPRIVAKTWESQANKITTARFSNGAVLRGKPDHKVFTWDRGWLPLDALSLVNTMESDSIMRRISWALRRWFTRASNTGFSRQVDISSRSGRMSRSDFFTGSFGSSITDPFQRAMSCIIGMMTGAITRSGIWDYCPAESTRASICSGSSGVHRQDCGMPGLSIWRGSRPQSGMEAQRASSGIANTEGRLGADESRLGPKPHALIAAGPSSHTSCPGPDSVLIGAGTMPRTFGIKRLAAIALSAVRALFLTSTESRSVVPVSVQTDSTSESVTVYNLTLDRDNVYYANGILVANCLTFAMPEMPGIVREGPISYRPGMDSGTNKLKHEWDPLTSY